MPNELQTLFKNPPASHRGVPFWSWNNKLDANQLVRQIGHFETMGFGGAMLHSRTGLETDYLGEEFMKCIGACVERVKASGMTAWLYDEDRWPSGYAGGKITQNEAFRARYLLLTRTPYCGKPVPPRNISNSVANRQENGELQARYEVVLENGFLKSYRRLAAGEKAGGGGFEWLAYLEVAPPIPWFNAQPYVDALNKKAMEAFVESTYVPYEKRFGKEFGKAIPAIFTDEPQHVMKSWLRSPEDTNDQILPFTPDFPQTYQKATGRDFWDTLPEVFWERPNGGVSEARYLYHDHCTERFVEAFGDTIGKWCAENGIQLVGHMMEEQTLESQTRAIGEVMRFLRTFHIPGVDMLVDRIEFGTVKQAASVAHQYGRNEVMSELYGVTGWDYDFVGHKAQGDWQAALGINVRVPHLAWVSMAGESKRDYPASIFYQSPWFEEYKLVEDYFARVKVCLTQGKALVRVAVIHPVESFWVSLGNNHQTQAIRDELDTNFKSLNEWLIHGLLDFDFLCESLLPSQSPSAENGALAVGEMSYQAVLVPSLRTIRSSTLDALEMLVAAGGTVIFAGEIPHYVDAKPSDRALRLAEKSVSVPFTQRSIVDALSGFRELDVETTNGTRCPALISQIRDCGDTRFVFLANMDRRSGQDDALYRFRGEWTVSRLDPMDGTEQQLNCSLNAGFTEVRRAILPHGSEIFRLDHGWTAGGLEPGQFHPVEVARLDGPMPFTLAEPNVLLLDQAEWKINDGDWEPIEEILRIENLVRKQLGLPKKDGDIEQPWSVPFDPTPLASVSLRYVIASDVLIDAPRLALEHADVTQITIDGKRITGETDDWFIDESIRQTPLPSLAPGRHEIVLSLPFHTRINLEAIYLLGQFGVRVEGRRARITAFPGALAIGDITEQGLPFYGGNLTCEFQCEGTGRESLVDFPLFRGALLAVSLDDGPFQRVAFAPFQASLGVLSRETHKISVKVFGNRFNTLGTLHNLVPNAPQGPDAWRTTGVNWSYEYHTRPIGLLSAPRLLVV